MVKVYAVNISGIVVDPEWFRLVSEHKRQRLCTISDPQTLTQTLLGDLLIRFLAVKYLGVSNQNLLFSTTEFGKPYLVTGNQPFHFNLSHSGHWIVCAIDRNPVGIDVQLKEPVDIDLVKNILSPLACRHYLALLPEQQLDYFYDLWTLHEGYIKLTGEGLADPIAAPIDQLQNQAVFYRKYELESAYCLAACSFSNQFEPALFHIEGKSLVGELAKSFHTQILVQ